MMEALSDLVGSITKLFLVHPFHMAIFGCSFPLLKGPRDAWIKSGHLHDFSGKSRLEPIFEYFCGS